MTTTNIVLAVIAIVCITALAYTWYVGSKASMDSEDGNNAFVVGIIFGCILVIDGFVASGYNLWIFFKLAGT